MLVGAIILSAKISFWALSTETTPFMFLGLFSLVLVKLRLHRADLLLVKGVSEQLLVSHLDHFAKSVDLCVDLRFFLRFGLTCRRFKSLLLVCNNQLLLELVHDVMMP